jgi:hypothetical protein
VSKKPKIIRWTQICTGCSDIVDGRLDGNYAWDAKAKCHKGMGCKECGYTGKSRREWSEPTEDEIERLMEQMNE